MTAEDEPSTRAIGWDPFRVDNGFAQDSSTASVLLVTNHSAPIYTAGESAEAHLETIARILANAIGPWAYTSAVHGGFNPLLLLSPNVAWALHEFGVDKTEIRTYLYEHLRIRADIAERYAHQVGRTDFSFATSIDDPVLRESWAASEDPARLVPMLIDPDWTSGLVSSRRGADMAASRPEPVSGSAVSATVRHPVLFAALQHGAAPRKAFHVKPVMERFLGGSADSPAASLSSIVIQCGECDSGDYDARCNENEQHIYTVDSPVSDIQHLGAGA